MVEELERRRDVDEGRDVIMRSRCDIKCVGCGVKRAGNEVSTPSSIGDSASGDASGPELLRWLRMGGSGGWENRCLGSGGR